MTVIGVKEVEAARGTLVVGPNDVVTPLALERAAQLGVTIDGGKTFKDARGSPVPSAGAPATEETPPSGTLYRRGAPVATGRVRPPNIFRGEIPRGNTPRTRSGRVTVVGAGHVGATTAMRLAEADVFTEVVMTDVVPGLAAGLALDLWHSSGLRGFATHLRGTVDPAETAGSDFVVVTAGRARQPGMSRSDLTVANSAIVSEVAETIALHSPDAIVVMVTNPLDEMTHLAWQRTGFASERVMGMAGVLDTTRFCALVALATGQRPDAVSAVALGSHGDEMVIPLSQARIGSQPIVRQLDVAKLNALVERARDSGAEVVRLLERGSAYYAPAAAVARMVLAMANDTREVLPACVMANGAYGIADVFLGLPARLGADGVIEIVELDLTAGELDELRTAARRIAERVGQLVAG